MDIVKSETFKNFIILNKALLFLIKLLSILPLFWSIMLVTWSVIIYIKIQIAHTVTSWHKIIDFVTQINTANIITSWV